MFTLYNELSISACPIVLFEAVDSAGLSTDSDELLPCVSNIDFAVSCVGLNAPHILKLNFANFHCSITYGKADSLILPIICLDINNPANC